MTATATTPISPVLQGETLLPEKNVTFETNLWVKMKAITQSPSWVTNDT
ncbi:MAG: hypothetical protein F6J95_019875 [Leptolyngbya sp. SIO1E4]|nr:hypothetical protein [Leptolyngbya sp. SIO1E4]